MVEFFSDLTDEEYRDILERARFERSKAVRELFSAMIKAGAPTLKMTSDKSTGTPNSDGSTPAAVG